MRRSKQPIKIEKPFQSLLTFSHSASEKNIVQSGLLSFFSVFIFSMPSKVILIVIEFVLEHNYVLGPSQTHFSPRLAARAKMSLSRAQNIFTPANITLLLYSR